MTQKEYVLEIIKYSSYLRNKLSFEEHLQMYLFFESLNDNDIRARLKDYNIKITKKNILAKDASYWISNGLVAASLFVPIPGLSAILLKVKNSVMIPCKTKCLKASGETPLNVSLCSHQCNYLSIKYTVDLLEKELKKCPNSKDPKKCNKRLYKLLIKWKPKLEEAKIDLETKKRSIKYKMSQRG